jgi:UMF1 family MFS transporter
MSEAVKKRGLFSWALYDWANSSYFVIIQTFIFAAYFTRSIAENPTLGTAQWGNTISAAGIIIALFAPLLGAVADKAGQRKPWIAFFSLMCITACALLWYAEPDSSFIIFSLVMVFFATVGAEFSFIFYSAMLPDLVSHDRIGRWSGWGWGLGYAGGLACLLVALFAFIQTEGFWLGLNVESAEHIRATFLLTAVWFALFSIPIFIWTPDTPSTKLGFKDSVQQGMRQLADSIKEVRKFKNIVRFLFARMFYNDGLVTIFALGGVYAAGTFEMDESEILMFGVGLNITSGLGAFGFSWMDDKSGSKKTILISLAGLILPLIALVMVKTSFWFIIFGLILGFFVGPVQAASRTLMARLAPADMMNQMFGLFALSGKVTSFIGPFLVGSITLLAGSQRIGMLAILLLLLLGFLIMLGVNEAPTHRTLNEK